MADAPRDRDRLFLAEKANMKRDTLVGSFFHSDARRGWQGCVVAEPMPGHYLVETFDWLAGSSHDQRLVTVHDMWDWRFYDTAEWMRNSGDSVQRAWDAEREAMDKEGPEEPSDA